jgi:poly(A) polymerase
VQPQVYSVNDHEISSNLIDPDALFVLHKLREAGFLGYLVGGSVRDLLLKRTPKDFDISTSARPEQIKHLFGRQCLLIGRRFRLAHIRFGHKVIEVSTFRSGENENDLIVQDNQWGDPQQDVLRRDFTINGLFYDPASHSVIDYVGGWEDIHNNNLRTIGDPCVRFRQDPVRMIRLLKFRARFGFNILAEERKALLLCRKEILKSSPARILEEALRMLESGSAASFFNLMLECGLMALLHPTLVGFLQGPVGKETLLFLASADKINAGLGKKTLDRALLISCLLFPILSHRLKTKYLDQGSIPHMGEVIIETSTLVQQFETGAFIHFPRRLMAIAATVLANQYRLTPPGGKKQHHQRLLRNKEFLGALTFLKIRAVVDKELIPVYASWKSLYRQHVRQGDRRHPHPPPSHHKTETEKHDDAGEG